MYSSVFTKTVNILVFTVKNAVFKTLMQEGLIEPRNLSKVSFQSKVLGIVVRNN